MSTELPPLPDPDARRSEVADLLANDLWSVFDENLANAFDPDDTLGLYPDDENADLNVEVYNDLLVDFVSRLLDPASLYTATRLARVRAARSTLRSFFDETAEEDDTLDFDEWVEENLGYLDVEWLVANRDELHEVDAAWLTVFENGA